jgi:hypothetical protein
MRPIPDEAVSNNQALDATFLPTALMSLLLLLLLLVY